MGFNSESEINNERQHKRLSTRHNEEGEAALDLDRISDLPDSIISHILSFLEIKCAMKTSILSLRWRYLWASVDILDLSDCSFDDESFQDFVEHVLFHSTSKNIRKFDLHCGSFSDLAHINTWICYVLATKNVSTLYLHVEDNGDFFPIPPLPKCILTCNTLVTLVLNTCFDVKIPATTISFPCLNYLFLTGVYPDDEQVLQILSMCPVLENFYLQGFLHAHELVVLFISVPSLKKLKLELMIDDFGFYEHNVIIDTPNLEELDIVDDTFAQFIIRGLDSICKVSLDFGGFYADRVEPQQASRLVQLIKSVTSTEDLFLLPGTTAVISRNMELSLGWSEGPTFPNLAELNMWTYELFGWTSLSGILESAPYLECLELVKAFDFEFRSDADDDWIAPECVPDCLLNNLVVVKLEFSRGRKDDLQVLEYLLKNAQALEFMLVGVIPHFLNNELVKKLVTFPRCSQICKVVVYQAVDLWH